MRECAREAFSFSWLGRSPALIVEKDVFFFGGVVPRMPSTLDLCYPKSLSVVACSTRRTHARARCSRPPPAVTRSFPLARLDRASARAPPAARGPAPRDGVFRRRSRDHRRERPVGNALRDMGPRGRRDRQARRPASVRARHWLDIRLHAQRRAAERHRLDPTESKGGSGFSAEWVPAGLLDGVGLGACTQALVYCGSVSSARPPRTASRM